MKAKLMRHCLSLIFAGITLIGCNTVTFVQYEQPGEHKTTNRWHHATINGMVELSPPLDVRDICDEKAWTNITTEFTFYNFLVGTIVPVATYVSLYSSWTNSVQCFESAAD
jgi:hypothetical protein